MKESTYSYKKFEIHDFWLVQQNVTTSMQAKHFEFLYLEILDY